jgi:hypothetical protein
MSLLTKNENTTASLSKGVDKIAGHITVAIKTTNKLALDLLALNNEDLVDWLNSKPVEQRMEEFAAHGLLGEYLNATAGIIEEFIPTSLERVDTRSFREKLATYRRELSITQNGFSVVDMPLPVSVVIDEYVEEPEQAPLDEQPSIVVEDSPIEAEVVE